MALLVYGYGNPGRQDDGLGIALVEALERRLVGAPVAGVAFERNYQLNAEDALTISAYDAVIFADAAVTGDEPFAFRRLMPAAAIAFSTHAMAPEAVLALCAELYDRQPDAHLLTIRGHGWEPNAVFTAAAEANLAAALVFLQSRLTSPPDGANGSLTD